MGGPLLLRYSEIWSKPLLEENIWETPQNLGTDKNFWKKFSSSWNKARITSRTLSKLEVVIPRRAVRLQTLQEQAMAVSTQIRHTRVWFWKNRMLWWCVHFEMCKLWDAVQSGRRQGDIQDWHSRDLSGGSWTRQKNTWQVTRGSTRHKEATENRSQHPGVRRALGQKRNISRNGRRQTKRQKRKNVHTLGKPKESPSKLLYELSLLRQGWVKHIQEGRRT